MTDFTSFNLPHSIQTALARLNFVAPTPIQAQTIPAALEGKDLIASAETGSGKTAAFCIPIIAGLLEERGATALIVVPTRELAGQISRVVEDLGGRSMRAAILIGGVGMHGQVRSLREGPQVIIATPGRLVDHLQQTPALLKNVRYLVLDEADRMLDMGFAPQLREILKSVPSERQTLLFSATYPSDIQDLSARMMRDPVRIAIGSVVKPVQAIDQQVIEVDESSKNTAVLKELKSRSGSVIIFTRTKRRADRLTRALNERGERASQIHGGRSQRQRESALQSFRRGSVRVLVATDIAARGIDVPEIEHVINYDLPFVAEDYLHRIGRTGRAGRTGNALCMVAPQERQLWRSIERLMSREGARSSKEQREESQALRREISPRSDSRQGNSPRPRGRNPNQRRSSEGARRSFRGRNERRNGAQSFSRW